jgi:hypothetical protein
MAEVIEVTTAPGLAFDVLIDGPEQGAPVLLLHGFAESFHTWDAQIAALAGSGYRAIAPSQRGYSPGARPHAADTNNYIFDRLVDDPMQIASKLGLTRFHLVGRPAAEWTREYVTAPYEFTVLPGGGHFTADQMPEAVSTLMLKHLKRFPL